MSHFTEAERATLARLHVKTSASPHAITAGVGLADRLRRELPDLDDLTIGRVALKICAFQADVVAMGQSPHPRVHAEQLLQALGLQLTCACLDLTQLEWKDEVL